MQTLFSPRLILRQWQPADRGAFAMICADPQAMEFLLPLPTADDSNGWIDRQIAHQATFIIIFSAGQERSCVLAYLLYKGE
ncbi:MULTISPECIES: GNAT family N-acetyltransferase [Brenneria]|uniref:N-acetyltransferase n=1 Tax=Brenneria nigrifluens DSM 30175 = ATCC 13028 TaxID=1121120 RepID=A0A2U1USF0_9GAMM|nr:MULTISPECIES: GNAT family N-acetyltransferase [Brenneria]EHD21178.1 GCN5-related N-acetyltransferase [Brenneria sp. EniD312]PWC24596.1 N-acetyltransferase [Brenneria nigrifluens] [Brenneria nigrifluens DSM 30175 = ATCC 13028]QCR04324.1 N-acetyltransferase [Brenneria nigrifluens] [Brenneria nigrifluens DSM 30175 = ATCC 13028]